MTKIGEKLRGFLQASRSNPLALALHALTLELAVEALVHLSWRHHGGQSAALVSWSAWPRGGGMAFIARVWLRAGSGMDGGLKE